MVEKLSDLYIKGDISPRVNDRVLFTLMENKEMQSSQIAFAYCYVGVLSYLHYNLKYYKHHIKVEDIKRWLGYSSKNKRVDKFTKKNGLLDQLGIIIDVKNPYCEEGKKIKNRVKIPLFDEMEKAHTFNLGLFFECMKHEELGVNGFLFANYINEMEKNYVYGERGTGAYLTKKLGMNHKTVHKYLDLLREYQLIECVEPINTHDRSAIALKLRHKINDWIDWVMDNSGGKCFVTGVTNQLEVHHVVPFKKIVTNILFSTGIGIKPIEEYSEVEIDILTEKLLEAHEVVAGVVMNKRVHNIFHWNYGSSNVGMFELLEFKERYLNGEFVY